MTASSELLVDFAGELHRVKPTERFTIGREADLSITDNLYLHRIFLEIRHDRGLWWVHNVGSRLAAYVNDERRLLRTTLAPGGSTPLVFAFSFLSFVADRTSYEIALAGLDDVYQPAPHRETSQGETTKGQVSFTPSQLVAVLALAEPLLLRAGTGAAEVPPANRAAQRLGWSQSKFTRKLDNVCEKLAAAGVRGLRGDFNTSAANRRLRLAEYAVSTLLVTPADLALLDNDWSRGAD